MVVAALVDREATGVWAESVVLGGVLAAPHLMPVESANVLRRMAASGEISNDIASLAHEDLLALRVELFGYAPVAARAWELRANVTSYDAGYVALAETLGVGLATLDRRLAGASGPRCRFVLPDSPLTGRR